MSQLFVLSEVVCLTKKQSHVFCNFKKQGRVSCASVGNIFSCWYPYTLGTLVVIIRTGAKKKKGCGLLGLNAVPLFIAEKEYVDAELGLSSTMESSWQKHHNSDKFLLDTFTKVSDLSWKTTFQTTFIINYDSYSEHTPVLHLLVCFL